MVYITPLVINALGGGHTDIYTHTYIPMYEPKQFQETRHAQACSRCAPHVKRRRFTIQIYRTYNEIENYIGAIVHTYHNSNICAYSYKIFIHTYIQGLMMHLNQLFTFTFVILFVYD